MERDPQELEDLAASREHDAIVARLSAELHRIVDPQAQDRRAKTDQRALLDAHGGRDAVVERGGFGATPAPGVKPSFA